MLRHRYIHTDTITNRGESMPEDPVCKMEVDETSTHWTEHKGKTYYFCCPSCKARFEKDPEKYLP